MQASLSALSHAARLRAHFERLYGGTPRIFSAPGRVNLIGEHTDYNDGFVLPMAIERRTYVAGIATPGQRVLVHSLNNDERASFELNAPGPKQRGIWLDYAEGMAQSLLAAGFALGGATLLIDSEVPAGAGLSPSAALELALGYALVRLSGSAEPDLIELALCGQRAEHEYVGTHCGIMDQYIVALGQPAQALLIDCRSLRPTPVPLALGSACVLVCDTRVKHALSSSAYNERREQCNAAVALLAARLPGVRALRDVSGPEFDALSPDLPALLAMRARHVICENARTLAAAACLAAGQLPELGVLMNESHESLRLDYEVSCAELDTAVSAARGVPGVYGSRMTGGGFGGCTVTLLERAAVPAVTSAISSAFAERFSSQPEFFATGAEQGVREE